MAAAAARSVMHGISSSTDFMPCACTVTVVLREAAPCAKGIDDRVSELTLGGPSLGATLPPLPSVSRHTSAENTLANLTTDVLAT